jgi:hypothetical protein
MFHWLKGDGSPMPLSSDSATARAIPSTGAFKAVNIPVQTYISGKLATGVTGLIVVPSYALANVDFGDLLASDLSKALNAGLLPFIVFRGTQGITVTGDGIFTGSSWEGTLTYTIIDTFGFKGNDRTRLGPFINRLHYLQANCGQPKYPRAPHWFTDSITVTVPFEYTPQ